MLSIAPERQRQGAGRRLIDAVESRARERGCRFMDIHIVNLREELPPYYRRLGYVESGTLPFSEPERASKPCFFIVMTKPPVMLRLADGLQPYNHMRVRIIRRPTGVVDGMSLHYYHSGQAYDVSPELAEYLVASGFASIEMRRGIDRPGGPPSGLRIDRRSVRR